MQVCHSYAPSSLALLGVSLFLSCPAPYLKVSETLPFLDYLVQDKLF